MAFRFMTTVICGRLERRRFTKERWEDKDGTFFFKPIKNANKALSPLARLPGNEVGGAGPGEVVGQVLRWGLAGAMACTKKPNMARPKGSKLTHLE